MRVKKAYKLEKTISKLGIHALDMLVWHSLRWWLNRCLPQYYKKNPPKTGKPLNEYTDESVIISLTTYPKRMDTLPLVLETLMRQTVKPTKIQLWLADEQYPDKKVVFQELTSFINRGLEIMFCDDLKSHKKYYYAMLDNQDSIIVTADDDIIYPEDMLESLLKKHNEYPKCIVTHRAHQMKMDGKGLLPYNKWNYRAKGCIGPDIYLCATGGAGCLYPPHLLSEHVFDKDVFRKICFYADDIWLKCMEQLNEIPVVLTGENNPEIISTMDASEGGLAQMNVEEGKNDQQLRAVTEYYNIKW